MNRVASSLLVFTFLCPAVFAQDRTTDSPREEDAPAEEVVRLADIEVSPRVTVLEEELGEKIVLGSEARKLPLIDNDVFRAVQVHPGVTGGDFNASVAVRGGETDETLVLIDGVEIFRPFHLQDYGGALSVLDMLAVEKVELSLGGFPPEYGDRLSGVLEVDLRSPSQELKVNAGLDLLNAHAFLSADPLLVALRAGYIGLLMGLMQSEEKFEPHYWDVLARWTHPASGPSQLGLGVLYAGDTNTMDKAGEDDDVWSLIHNGAVWLRWQAGRGEDLSFDSHLYTGWYHQVRRVGTKDFDDRDLSYAGLKTSLSTTYTESTLLKAGFDLRWMRGVYAYHDESAGIDISAEPEGVTFRGFLQNQWRIAPGLDATFGGRLITQSPNWGVYVVPSVALSWSPVEGLTFKGAWGSYLQPVDPLHLPVEAGQSGVMRPESAMHWLGGMQYRSRKWELSARVEAYYKKMDHLAGFVWDFGRSAQIHRVPDAATAAGLEVVLDKRLGDFNVHLGYTYAVAREESGGLEYYRDNDQRHALNLGLSLAPGKGWFINALWRFHSGHPYTRSWYEGSTQRFGPPNEGRLPPYHSFDLRVSKQFTLGDTKIQVYLQILNLYNRENVHEYSWTETTQGAQTVYVREAEPLFPILPSLGINIVF
jgi:hypothetical protein